MVNVCMPKIIHM